MSAAVSSKRAGDSIRSPAGEFPFQCRSKRCSFSGRPQTLCASADGRRGAPPGQPGIRGREGVGFPRQIPSSAAYPHRTNGWIRFRHQRNPVGRDVQTPWGKRRRCCRERQIHRRRALASHWRSPRRQGAFAASSRRFVHPDERKTYWRRYKKRVKAAEKRSRQR